VILEPLVSQNQKAVVATEKNARALVPGLGDACLANVESGWPAVDRSLKQIGLRGWSGATVIAIQRGLDKIIYPSADEVLCVGDTLVLAGSTDSVQTAKRILGEGL
jgi:CPA2 family monovalent cation:H+ antiporter-2